MVINAADVQRWTQPVPFTAEGHASFGFDCTATSSVAVVALARLIADCAGPTGIPTLGFASFILGGSMLLMPNMFGDATIEFDCEAPANRPPLNLGLAQFGINCSADTITSIEALSTPVLFSFNDFRVDAYGVAEVSLFDYGWGSPPVFPFKFPTRFTDNLLNEQDAAADIRLDGTSFDGGAGADAVATAAITTSNQFMLQGNLPVFPWWFPIVFDDEADVNVGLARILGMYSEASSAAACLGAVLLPEFDCEGLILGQTMFPFRFPSVFWAPWQDCPAEFSLDATSPAAAAVYAPTLAVLESDAVVEVPQTGSAAIELEAVSPDEAAVDGLADLDASGDSTLVFDGIASAAIVYDNAGTDEMEASGLATIAMFAPDTLVDVIEALADIIISASADDITVAGYADALAGIAAICAAVIPQTGSAALGFDTAVANVVAAEGVASMLITSTAVTVDVMVFPFRFPAMFIPAYGNPPILPVVLPILFS